MSVDGQLTQVHLARAKEHVYNVCSQGAPITLQSNTESFPLKAFPVRFSPFDRKIAAKISWSDDVDIIFYVSKKALDEHYTIKQLKAKFKSVEYDKKSYAIKHIEPHMSFADDFLSVVIGAVI